MNIKRVIVIGLPKCGTSSIDYTLKNKNYITCHQYYKNNNSSILIDQSLKNNEPAFSRVENLIKKDHQNKDIKIGYAQLDFCNENYNIWPQLTHLNEMCDCYPDAYFILNYRDTNRHVRSIKNFFNFQQQLVMNNIVGLPIGKGANDEELANWINHINRDIKSFFSKTSLNFLELKIDDKSAKEKLQKFLDEGKIEWKVMNKNPNLND